MIDRVYYRELECYQNETQTGHKYDEQTAYYDLSILPTDTMREEFRRFLINEGTHVTMRTILQHKTYYKQIVSIMDTVKRKPSSFLSWDEKRWIQTAKMWMMQNGVAFYESKITVYGTQGYREATLLRYLRRLLRFLQPEDTRPEQEKDIWRLDRLGIPIEENPIYRTETLNFTKITQDGIREEVKRAIYLQLKIEKLGTVQGELTSFRRFSKYLREKGHEI